MNVEDINEREVGGIYRPKHKIILQALVSLQNCP